MSTKDYDKYLPEKVDTKPILIQAKIDPELHERVKQIMDERDYTWHDLLSGLLAKFADDSKGKKRAG